MWAIAAHPPDVLFSATFLLKSTRIPNHFTNRRVCKTGFTQHEPSQLLPAHLMPSPSR